MQNLLTKLDVARHQLGTALDLFIRDVDPVSVQCLACGGSEMIEAVAHLEKIEPFSTHILRTQPQLDLGKVRGLQRQYWNAFKHMTSRKGEVRDDSETLAAFDDTKNDVALFIGWWDYQSLVNRLPIAAQVFQVWFYAMNEEKLAPGTDVGSIRAIFGNIVDVDRAEQKKRLRLVVEHYSTDKNLIGNPLTEDIPLCVPAAAFSRQGRSKIS